MEEDNKQREEKHPFMYDRAPGAWGAERRPLDPDLDDFDEDLDERVEGDTIREVHPIDGVSAPDAGGEPLWVNYDIAECYFASYGKGYAWMFEYDTSTKRLYVPLVDEAMRTTDRYMVYQHDGHRFVCLDEQPHKGIHSSVSDYVRLVRYFNVAGHIGRIDSLADGKLRLAVWKRPKTMSNKPDFVL